SALQGKILRITPDLALHPNDKLSENGRYRIPTTGPDANPFVSVPGARGEIYAYGFRNPHRMDWDTATGRLFYTDLAEMIAAHGERGRQAAIHEIQIMYKSPYDASEKAPAKRRMYDIVADAFAHKDGVVDPITHQGVLPGAATATGGWRGKNFVTAK